MTLCLSDSLILTHADHQWDARGTGLSQLRAD